VISQAIGLELFRATASKLCAGRVRQAENLIRRHTKQVTPHALGVELGEHQSRECILLCVRQLACGFNGTLEKLRHVCRPCADERVLVLDEGNGARQVFDVKDAPVRSVVVGIIDDVGENPPRRGRCWLRSVQAK